MDAAAAAGKAPWKSVGVVGVVGVVDLVDLVDGDVVVDGGGGVAGVVVLL